MPSSHEEGIFSEREVSELSKLRRLPVYLCILGILLGLGDVLSQPCLFVKAGGQRVAVVPAAPGTSFTIHFIHSVQKTPVLENLEINDEKDGFNLLSTKYQSFGVGLPFLAEEGDFREEGDYYIPKLTTVRQPVEQMAEETVNLLFDMIQKKAKPKNIIMPAQLLIKESSGTGYRG